MAQVAKQDFILHLTTNAPNMFSSQKRGANYVYTHFNTG